MNTKINAQTILIVLMLCVTMIISSNSYANAQGGGENNSPFENASTDGGSISAVPVPGGPGFIMVNPVDFRPYTTTTPWAYTNASLYNPSTTSSSQMVAGLTLPHRAKITKITLFYLDNYSGGNCIPYLLSKDVTGVLGYMTSISTDGALPDFRYVFTTIFNNPIIDNQNYSYYLYLVIPQNASTDILITNIRIDYEYTVYTPAIMK